MSHWNTNLILRRAGSRELGALTRHVRAETTGMDVII